MAENTGNGKFWLNGRLWQAPSQPTAQTPINTGDGKYYINGSLWKYPYKIDGSAPGNQPFFMIIKMSR